MSNVTKKSKRDKMRAQITELLAKLQILQEKVKEPHMISSFNLFNRSIMHRDNYSQIRNLKKKIDILDRKLRVLEAE